MAASFCVHVVDDDASVRRALVRLLQANGYQVRAYALPEQFLAEPDPGGAGCLLLDIAMPRLSGLQLQARMNELGWTVPVIAISALDDNKVRERARELGASFFFRKPVDAQALIDAIAWVSASEVSPAHPAR